MPAFARNVLRLHPPKIPLTTFDELDHGRPSRRPNPRFDVRRSNRRCHHQAIIDTMDGLRYQIDFGNDGARQSITGGARVVARDRSPNPNQQTPSASVLSLSNLWYRSLDVKGDALARTG